MKSVTEFPSFTLSQGLKTKATLTSEGKSPEEIQESLGTTFKMEGDRLKHFVNALDVAGQNPDKLKRVLVVSYAEGENVHPKAVKVEESHYVPEFLVEAKSAAKQDDRGGRGGRGGGRGGPGGRGGGNDRKGSPWGITPEEKAAKAAAAKNAAAKK